MMHVKTEVKNGKAYHYHRPTKTRLPDDPGSKDFMVRLNELNAGLLTGKQKEREWREENAGTLYFIQAEAGPIKIGFTKGDPKVRLQNLQVSHYDKLTIIGFYPGTVALEGQILKVLRKHRIRGEWFKPHDDVFEALANPSSHNLWRHRSEKRTPSGDSQKW